MRQGRTLAENLLKPFKQLGGKSSVPRVLIRTRIDVRTNFGKGFRTLDNMRLESTIT